MPHYFFHITHDGPRVDDTFGIDLANQKAAWDEATRTCGEMITEIDGQLAVGTDWQMDVDDENGPLFTIKFGAQMNRAEQPPGGTSRRQKRKEPAS